MKLTAGVNFIKILRADFLHKSYMHSFSCSLSLCLYFLVKGSWQKGAHKMFDHRYLIQPSVQMVHPSFLHSYLRYPSHILRTPPLFLTYKYVTPTTTTLSQGTDRRQRDVLASQGEELPLHVESPKKKSSNDTIEGIDVSALKISAREEGGIDITDDAEGRNRKVQGQSVCKGSSINDVTREGDF